MQFTKIWACGSPDCNHHMPQHLEELVNGKASICWQCDEKFVLTGINMKQDKPICSDCALGLNDIPVTVSEETVEVPSAEAILKFVRS